MIIVVPISIGVLAIAFIIHCWLHVRQTRKDCVLLKTKYGHKVYISRDKYEDMKQIESAMMKRDLEIMFDSINNEPNN